MTSQITSFIYDLASHVSQVTAHFDLVVVHANARDTEEPTSSLSDSPVMSGCDVFRSIEDVQSVRIPSSSPTRPGKYTTNSSLLRGIATSQESTALQKIPQSSQMTNVPPI